MALSQAKQVLEESLRQGEAPEAIQRRLQSLLPAWNVTLQSEPGPVLRLTVALEKAGKPPPAPASPNAVPAPVSPSTAARTAPEAAPVLVPPEKQTVTIYGPAPTSLTDKLMALVGSGGKPVDGFVLPIPSGGETVSVLRISANPSGVTVLRTLLSRVLITLALALFLAGLIGWWFSRWLSRPIARLTEATAAVAGGDFLQTLSPTGVEELDRLTDQFNTMVLRLRESFRSLAAERDVARRFAADAAHELRTPVTALRTYQEVAEEHPERSEQLLPAIGRQVQRLERIINGLMQMAALSEGTGLELAPADLGGALAALAPGLRAMAEECGHSFTLARPEAPLTVRLDPQLLERVLFNLMDNACKYTPPGGRIEVALRAEGDAACLSVRDDGPGIRPEELPHLFERFHRGIDTQSIPGSGLGLAIVQAAAERLGGHVSVGSAPGVGSCFTLRLPLAA